VTSSANQSSPLGPGPEFDRIRSIVELLGNTAGGLGDDCALIRTGNTFIALSTDVSVEGIHFQRQWMSLREVGWRAAAAALSDLAAEGARAVGLLTAVTVPTGAADSDLLEVMAGVGAAAKFANAQVIGGDLSTGTVWSLAVTVAGRADAPITRAGARPGDQLWVTGELGAARVALEAWQNNREPPPAARARFVHPEPRIAAGQWLARNGATAMIDLSDGIAGDVGHLAAASQTEMTIDLEALPIAADVLSEAARRGISAGQFGAEAGEDYELLVALPSDFTGQATFVRDCGIGLRNIGRVNRGSGVRFLSQGTDLQLAGFNHFG
jgi:thiamine-monophosphate kinase